MATRRMFSMKIIDTDMFLNMPVTARLLYYDLSMRADDDGFVASPKKIQRMIGCSDDDLKLLIAKKFIIPFESGICVIRHWRIHNYIQADRYNETLYQEEKSMLKSDNNKAYELIDNNPSLPVDTECIQNVSTSDTQVRLGKDRKEIGKDSIDKKQPDLNSYTSNKDLISAINDFIDMRKKIKKPMTDRALALLLSNLDKLSTDDTEKIEILNQSILHSWQTVYQLKEVQENGKHNGDNKQGEKPKFNFDKYRK